MFLSDMHAESGFGGKDEVWLHHQNMTAYPLCHKPAISVSIMVWFACDGSELQARSFLELLDSAHVSNAASCRIKVRGCLLHRKVIKKEGTMVTVTWTKNTGRIRVQSAATVVDLAMEQLKGLWTTYEKWCDNQTVLPPPVGLNKQPH